MSNEYKSNSLRKKPSIRSDGSYRMFHITRKHDDSDDEENPSSKTRKNDEVKPKQQKKSFKISNRHGLDGWKRRSTKNKRLLFLHKNSCESTSNEPKTPPLSRQSPNDRSLNEGIANQKKEIFDSEEEIDGVIADNDNTLNDLLARANQLETTVKKQKFDKIQPLTRTNIHQRRKHFLIICAAILIILTLVIFIVIITLGYQKHADSSMRSPSIPDG